VLSHPALEPRPGPATPTAAPPATPEPVSAPASRAAQPAVYFGDRVAMKVWFWGAAVLACVLLIKDLAAVLLPR